MTIILPWQSKFSSWHWSYFTVLSFHSGKQELMLLQALPSTNVKVLVTLSWAHTYTHIKWKSKAIPPCIKLCRWSNGLSWWQGTIISSKEVRAADWRMKNIVQRGGWGIPRQTVKHPEAGFSLAFMINWCLCLLSLLLAFSLLLWFLCPRL